MKRSQCRGSDFGYTNSDQHYGGGKRKQSPDSLHAMPTFPVRRCLLVSARVVNHGRLTSPTSVRECAKLPALLKALLKDLIRLDPFKPCKVSTILYRALPNILGDYAYHRHQ